MPYDVVTSGPPNAAGQPYPAGGRTILEAIDTNTGAEWCNVGRGWQPNNGSVYAVNLLGTTAAQASLLTFVAPTSGLYDITVFAAQANATNGTLPNFTVNYTDADSGTALTNQPIVTGAATTGIGQAQSFEKVINVVAGTTVTVSASAPTTLTANERVRVNFIG